VIEFAARRRLHLANDIVDAFVVEIQTDDRLAGVRRFRLFDDPQGGMRRGELDDAIRSGSSTQHANTVAPWLCCAELRITYLDGDLYFFASPDAACSELTEATVAIIPHRYAPNLTKPH
jgi:hypothetical protein